MEVYIQLSVMKQQIELQSIIIIFIKEGEPNEILLCVIGIKELNAKYNAYQICSEIAVITCP